MRVLITGGTGLIGSVLCGRLLADGHQVTVWSRSPDTVKARCGEAVTAIGALEELDGTPVQTVINLAGEPIADKPWTAKRKAALWASRVTLTEQLVAWMGQQVVKPQVLISGSAVGWYGDGGEKRITEESSARAEYTHTLCDAWESAAKRAAAHGIRVCQLRTGLVVAPGGGFLQRLLLPFKLGLGGPIGSGQQYMPWVHLDDMLGIILFLLYQDQCKGPFNATAPHPVTNREFAKTLGKMLKRPAFMPLPGFILKATLGEMAGLLLTGQNAVPDKLLKAGYVFQFEYLDAALAAVLKTEE
ncbi:TIGR01777 family oxidoreductase [Halopseudomonas pelagia]|uniref:TIGR01777 family oxidoreductase n=1 Tax=Halopseudomonas pelagia TaxID=553151 RepID=UPI0030DDB83E|tara:strand:- start:475 stop:1377 length:903 start_codon:yes stop_codon:yes gene_type:complete